MSNATLSQRQRPLDLPQDDEPFAVHGEVVRPDGAPVPNQRVRAFDRALSAWRPLGDEVRTDASGRYTIAYDPAQLKQWGKARADLRLEVRDPSGDTLLAESALILSALPRETVNFSLGQQRYTGPDEYTRVERAVTPLLKAAGAAVAGLAVADVLILARQAGLAGGLVAGYVKAQRWATDLAGPAPLFYGLLRRGEPARLDGLLARPLAQLWARLAEARARNLIALPLDEAARKQLAQVQQRYLARPEHPFAQLLGATGLTAAQRATFTQRLSAGDTSGEAFWQSLAKAPGFTAARIAELRDTFALQAFADDNTGLTLRLRRDFAVRSPRAAASFSLEHWRDNVLNSPAVAIPDEVLPGADPAERRAAYALLLYRTAELRDPTAALAGQLARDPAWAKSPALAFLQANPELELREQRALAYLRERPDALKGLPAETRDDLLRLEQLFHLTPDADRLAAIQPLWQAGLRSAPQIAYLGRTNLMRRVGQSLDPKAAAPLYRKAVHITALALNLYLRYHPRLNGTALAAIQPPQLSGAVVGGQASVVGRRSSVVGGQSSTVVLPEWAELFGAPDACACEPCASAFSPAAYLVDTMAFLERAVGAGGKSALDELLARRPDLGALELSCANTDTELPQIDLVIEMLEAITASADGETLAGPAIGATSWPPELLAAQPEHMQPAAYDRLRAASYPFLLPFDHWAEEGRRSLRQLGLPRDELMRALPPKPGVTELAIAAEALGMSAAERELICRPRLQAAELAPAWGFKDARGLLAAKLGAVPALLRRAGIDYATLLQLLNTRFLNPARRIAVRFDGAPCSLDGAVLVAGAAELAGPDLLAFLDRLHRFLRLRRRLGCEVYELDGLIRALGVAELNAPNFVPKLAAAHRLRRDLGLSLGELGAWWSELDTYAYEDELPSQYEAVFLDPARFPAVHSGAGPDLRASVFALKADRSDLAVTASPTLSPWLAEASAPPHPPSPSPLRRGGAERSEAGVRSDGATYTLRPEYSAYVQSATRLSGEDLLLLAQELLPKDAATGHVALNLANLSLLYRAASLARALALSVKDMLRMVALTGVVPLRTPAIAADPLASARFRELHDEVAAGAHSVEALAYMLLHEPVAVAALGPLTTAADTWLLGASAGFAGILSRGDARVTAELRAAVAQSLAAALALDPAIVEALLFTHRPATGAALLDQLIVAGNPAAGLPAPGEPFATLYGRLHKLGLAWGALGLDQSFLAFVVEQGPGLGWSDIAALPMAPPAAAPYEPWRRLIAAAGLQASSFTLEQSLFALIEDARAAALAQRADPASFVLADFLAQISAWAGWGLADLTYLAGPSGFNLALPAAIGDERALVRLRRVFDMLGPRGIGAAQAHAWTIAELGFAEAQAIRQTLAMAHTPEAWLAVLGALNDELRPLRRDALLGHLLHATGLEDSEAFYAHYLIDPAESPCGRTTRIVEAIAAVQLFAQRILLNLEPFSFSRLDAEAWQWRKQYRVWEAARKVLLWPENWLEPELRDDKSAFFQELEDGLLQAEVTHEAAEGLYLAYLHRLNSVGQLEIMGMYREEATAEAPAVLHVFGRTRDVARQHYYRRWEGEARWTPWEPVEPQIEADHLVPIVSAGRLYLFWPELTTADNPNATIVTTSEVEVDPERADAIRQEILSHERRIDEIDAALDSPLLDSPNFKGDDDDLLDERATHEAAIALLEDELDALTVERTSVTMGDKYLMTVAMKWSEHRDGRWTSVLTSQEQLTYTTSNRLSRHYFTGWVGTDGVMRVSARINLVGSGEGVELARSPEGYIGHFAYDACGGGLVASSAEITDPEGELTVTGALADYHAAAWYDTWWSSGSFELELGAEKRLLLESPGRLVYAHQDGQFGREDGPFFFTDGARTYFVRPVEQYRSPGLQTAHLTPAAARLPLSAAKRGPGGEVGAKRGPGGEVGTTNGVTPVAQLAAPRGPTPLLATQGGALQHMQATASAGLIVDRASTQLVSTTMAGTVGAVLLEDPAPLIVAGSGTLSTVLRYQFTRFYHPYTCLFIEQQLRYGIDGLLNPDPAWGPDSTELYRQLTPGERFDFSATYQPNLAWVSNNFGSEQLDERIDFDSESPYGSYNWELFYHGPMLIATRLMQNQRYADARRWLHAIFDPTCTDGDGPERFWKLKPFYEEQLSGPLASLEELLNDSAAFEQQVAAWERDPFNPSIIARMRVTAFMQATVMRYLDCLIQEADMLFRRDTREAIGEARQLYMLASAILGDPPELLPAQDQAATTPNLLLGRFRLEWNGLPGGNPLDLIASLLPGTLTGPPSGRPGARTVSGPIIVDTALNPPPAGAVTIAAQGGTAGADTLLLFCLPPNERLAGYWDTVADRLFKLRNCMSIAGQVRQLALFAPPIDPALLVRASAMGLSIESVLSGLYAPRPHYRFSALLQKALELCGEARSLGAALLAALEQQDGEELARLRAAHETALLETLGALKRQGVDEARATRDSLTKSREAAELRAAYYGALERVSSGEQKSLDKQEQSREWQGRADGMEVLASAFHVIPTATSTGPQFGGPHLGAAAQAVAGSFRAIASGHAHAASKAGIVAGYGRRFADWRHQAELARKELEQLDRQLLAAAIRLQLAEAEVAQHDQQLAQTREAEALLTLKFTNGQLYSWMVAQLAAVHYQTYQLAYRLAVQAESALRYELGPDEQGVALVRPDNWDSPRRGLLAGELLHQQLRQLEAAHMAANARELEITRHVSLFELDPGALLALRETGACSFHIPEQLFDRDFAGHYHRRIKAVRVSMPCVVGPYTNVSATLRLVDSWTRRSADPEDGAQPARDQATAPQLAIATSSASQDSGVFELSFGDPRYLPFEGAGAVSSWSLELPTTVRPFDYATIADVVIHLSYTARDGGPTLKEAVNAGLPAALNDLGAPGGAQVGPARLLSLRHEFASAWQQLTAQGDATARSCTLQLSRAHFPAALDNVWAASEGGAIVARALTLNVTGLTAHLSSAGPPSGDAARLIVNGRAPIDLGLGIPSFDLLGAGALSATSIGADDLVTVALTVGGMGSPEEWGDVYLLLGYAAR